MITTKGSDEMDADVVIVGYGPVGATAANYLGQAGLDVVVIERDPEPYKRARAISTDEEVIRCWQHAGLAEQLKAEMLGDLPLTFVDNRGRAFLSFDLKPRGNGHPTQMFIYQPALERTIRAGVERFPNVTVLLEREAGAIRLGSADVELDVTDLRDGSRQVVRGRYLLACDGGSSQIRTQLQIGFEGKTFEDPWVVIDTKVKQEWPEMNRLRFHCDPQRPAVDCPTPLGHHRWEFPVLPGEDREEVSSEEYIWKLLARYGITQNHVEILRRAVYVHHVRFAERWRAGRVFLLGDAAHCMPPWIGQGMASGVRDAHNLCWKIAAVIRGDARPDLLDSYEPERKPHVRSVTDKAVFFGRVITERRKPLAIARNLGFSGVMQLPLIGSYLREGEWFPEPDYAYGFIDRSSRAQYPIVGLRLPQPEHDGKLLDDLLGTGWAIVSRTPRESGAWDGLAEVRVIDSLLDEFLGAVDAVVVRPDKTVYTAAAKGQALSPPPAQLHGAGAALALSPGPASLGEKLLAGAAARLDDRALSAVFGNRLALRGILSEMAKAYVPRVANGFVGEIQYDLGGAGSWTIKVAGARAFARRGCARRPAVTVRIALADFLRTAAGQLDQTELLKTRRVEITGDGLLASRLSALFGRPAPADIYVAPLAIDPPTLAEA